MEFSAAVREANLEQMKGGLFDVIVIGGGITGAGIARDAAIRGLSVVLVEKGDFASGTSSRSARMIHGGLRYLAHRQFRLVLSACAERNRLGKLAPRLVRPIAFTFPVYWHSTNSLLKIRLGMWLYYFLGLFRNIKRHRILNPAQTARLEPILPQQGLVGAAHYYDCLVDDARLTLATIQSAYQHGALVANYAQVSGLLKENGKVSGIQVLDRLSGETFTVRARATVNATGVWVDQVRHMDDSDAEEIIRANRGSHLVLPREKLNIQSAVAFIGADNNRAIYAVPWEETCIVGTTDVDHSGDLDEVTVTTQEVESLLNSTNFMFPGANLRLDDIISTFAGLRPLIDEKGKTPYQVSRDHQIIESQAGLISIAGGKLTTYRRMAEDLVDLVSERLEEGFGIRAAQNNKSDQVSLTDASFDPESKLAELAEAYPNVDHDVLRHLVHTYGTDCSIVLAPIGDNDQMTHRIVSGLPYIRAEIPYMIAYEMAVTLNDLLIRRTHIIHEDRDQGLGCAPDVALMMAQYLGWDSAEIKRQIGDYNRDVDLSRAYLN
jgi:glycerol-3-phosphate dehydrogenase